MYSKRIGLALLTAMLATPITSMAQEINNARWESYCKNNRLRCEQAERICEMHDGKITCDQVRQAFIMNRPLPGQTGPATDAPDVKEEKQNDD